MSESAAALLGDNGGAGAGAAQPSGTPAQTPAHVGPSWAPTLDPETTAYVTNKGWKEPTDILSSYRNLEKFAGGAKNLVEIPGETADEAALSAFYARLGRPESPDKYGLTAPQGGDPELLNWFTGTAHKLGLNQKQAASLFESWNGMAGGAQQKMVESQARESEQAIGSLKQEWGQKYDTMIDSGKRAVAALGYNADKLSALEAKMGTAEMLKLFATVGSKMGEDAFVGGDRSTGSFGLTPADAKQQIEAFKLDKELMAQYLAGSTDAVNKMRRLMEAAHGGT